MGAMAAVWGGEVAEPRNTRESESQGTGQPSFAEWPSSLTEQPWPFSVGSGLSGNLGIPLDREVEVLLGHCHLGVSFNKVTTRPQLSTMSLRYLKRSLSLSILPNKGLPDSRSSKMLKTQVPKFLPKSPSQRLSWRSSDKLHPGVLGNPSSGLPGALCKGLQMPLTTKEKPKFCRG